MVEQQPCAWTISHVLQPRQVDRNHPQGDFAMATVVRIPITNIFAGGDYTGVVLVGPNKQPMNVLLDTGSSALAVDGTKYTPDFDDGDQSTDLAQTDSFGDQ